VRRQSGKLAPGVGAQGEACRSTRPDDRSEGPAEECDRRETHRGYKPKRYFIKRHALIPLEKLLRRTSHENRQIRENVSKRTRGLPAILVKSGQLEQ
jgi:hypothetical protein